MEVETTTLWELLIAPSTSLHLPRFALFLIIAIPLEIYCDRKKVCLVCSIPPVVLQLLTGIGGLVVIYSMSTTSFSFGDRVAIPVWYYPFMGVLLCFLGVVFLNGIKGLLRDRYRVNAVVRSLIFGISVYFAISTIITPTKLNQVLKEWEKEAPAVDESADSISVQSREN